MSVNVPEHFVIQFSSNVQLLLQQKGSKLADSVMHGSYVGKQASLVDQVGAVEARKVTTRFAPMGRVDAALDRRWVFPVDYDLPQMLDQFDKLRMLTDLNSSYVTSAVYALGRKKDSEIITAFFGTAKTGEQGANSTVFPAGNTISKATGGADSRLNVEKLIEAREKLRAAHVDFDNDPIYCGITAKDESALLREVQVTSSEFAGADKPVLKDGKIVQFLGFIFKHCELLETLSTGTNKVRLPVWAKSGMHLGMWNDITSDISQRKDLQGQPWQAYVFMTAGATRIEEPKVLEIESHRV